MYYFCCFYVTSEYWCNRLLKCISFTYQQIFGGRRYSLLKRPFHKYIICIHFLFHLFTVDTAEAGKGEITIDIRNAHARLPIRVDRDSRIFIVHTTCKEAGIFPVVIKWNNEPITGELRKTASVSDLIYIMCIGEKFLWVINTWF